MKCDKCGKPMVETVSTRFRCPDEHCNEYRGNVCNCGPAQANTTSEQRDDHCVACERPAVRYRIAQLESDAKYHAELSQRCQDEANTLKGVARQGHCVAQCSY